MINERNFDIPLERRSSGLLNPTAALFRQRPLRVFQRGYGIAMPHQIEIHVWTDLEKGSGKMGFDAAADNASTIAILAQLQFGMQSVRQSRGCKRPLFI
jgi:hypothetical protein